MSLQSNLFTHYIISHTKITQSVNDKKYIHRLIVKLYNTLYATQSLESKEQGHNRQTSKETTSYGQ